jgi:hypothetical protein
MLGHYSHLGDQGLLSEVAISASGWQAAGRRTGPLQVVSSLKIVSVITNRTTSKETVQVPTSRDGLLGLERGG